MAPIARLLEGDAVSRGVALALLTMSVASWVVILWKAWWLRQARDGVARGVAAFWQAPSFDEAQARVGVFDRAALVQPLLSATQAQAAGTLAAAGDRSQQLTRALRDTLHGATHRLQAGQVWLATVGATAPFVGLLGTVWGLQHALTGLAGGGAVGLDQVAGPVGEALVMTAAGLVVAIPAVLAYNLQGRLIGRIEAELEGFARDLRDLLLSA